MMKPKATSSKERHSAPWHVTTEIPLAGWKVKRRGDRLRGAMHLAVVEELELQLALLLNWMAGSKQAMDEIWKKKVAGQECSRHRKVLSFSCLFSCRRLSRSTQTRPIPKWCLSHGIAGYCKQTTFAFICMIYRYTNLVPWEDVYQDNVGTYQMFIVFSWMFPRSWADFQR